MHCVSSLTHNNSVNLVPYPLSNILCQRSPLGGSNVLAQLAEQNVSLNLSNRRKLRHNTCKVSCRQCRLYSSCPVVDPTCYRPSRADYRHSRQSGMLRRREWFCEVRFWAFAYDLYLLCSVVVDSYVVSVFEFEFYVVWIGVF